jgi:hypothetical protein
LIALLACDKSTIDLFAEDAHVTDLPVDASVDGDATSDATSAAQGFDAGSDAGDSYAESSGGNADAGPAPRDAATELREGEASAGGCLSNTDCPSPSAPRCEPTVHQCVQCVGAADCANQANQRESACNLLINQCAPPCITSRDCVLPDVCDVLHGVCVDCLMDSQCGSGRHCVQEQCVECTINSDCRGDELCWQQRCVACVTNADCPDGGRCSASHDCI